MIFLPLREKAHGSDLYRNLPAGRLDPQDRREQAGHHGRDARCKRVGGNGRAHPPSLNSRGPENGPGSIG